MGRHSAGAHAGRPTPTTTIQAGPRAVPAVLAQTAAFAALAIVVAVLALVWAGVDGRVAAAVGVGLLLAGTLVFILVRRTGLLTDDMTTEVGATADPHL